jgi:hypothetical protein
MKNTDPIRRKIIFKRLVLVTALFYLLLCLLVIGIPFMRILSQSGEILLTETAIQQDTLATIVPQGGYDIRYATLNVFQSVHTHVRFTLLSSNLSKFLQGFCPDMQITDGGHITIPNEERLDWWKPEDAKIYSVGSCVEGNITIYKILIDKSDTNHFTVYITQ